MLKPHEACLRCKYQLKQIPITWGRNVATNEKCILREMSIKFQNPKFSSTLSIYIKKIFLTIFRLPSPIKCFCNWNISLNYCFICKINIRGYFTWMYSWWHKIPIFHLSHYFVRLEKLYMNQKVMFQQCQWYALQSLEFFFYLLVSGKEISNCKYWYFLSETLTCATVDLIERVTVCKKSWFVAGICLICKLE